MYAKYVRLLPPTIADKQEITTNNEILHDTVYQDSRLIINTLIVLEARAA